MDTRAYSINCNPEENALCFGDAITHEALGFAAPTDVPFNTSGIEVLLRRFVIASMHNELQHLWPTDTFLVLQGLARRSLVFPLYYWEQPQPFYIAGWSQEGCLVTPKAYQEQSTVVELWVPCFDEYPVPGGLIGHLQVAVSTSYNFETLRDILVSVGGNTLTRKFADGSSMVWHEEGLIRGALESSRNRVRLEQ